MSAADVRTDTGLTARAYTFNKRKAVMGKRTVGTITLSGGSVVIVECLLKVP